DVHAFDHRPLQFRNGYRAGNSLPARPGYEAGGGRWMPSARVRFSPIRRTSLGKTAMIATASASQPRTTYGKRSYGYGIPWTFLYSTYTSAPMATVKIASCHGASRRSSRRNFAAPRFVTMYATRRLSTPIVPM